MHKIELYQPEKHREQLVAWAKQWDWNETVLDILPTTGLIIDGVCATFLYETNSNICMMEGFICNKEADKKEREKCLDLIVDALLLFAKSRGFKYIKGDTRYKAVVDRGLKHGFKLTPYTYQALYRSL